MGINQSTARWLAPASFIIDFAAQQYGLLSTPNMKQIHDQNISFFSPQPYFIGAFFFPQQLLQIYWLYRLYQAPDMSTAGPAQRKDTQLMVNYAPWYAVGNLCIAAWMIFWNNSRLDLSHIFVTINSLSQLYYVAALLPPMEKGNTISMLTHGVAKTFAGIGVLDLMHNGSAGFFKDEYATPLIKVATGVGFGLAASVSDWIFGGCLVYDLVALSVGQASRDSGWSRLLGGYAVGAAAIVGLKNWAR